LSVGNADRPGLDLDQLSRRRANAVKNGIWLIIFEYAILFFVLSRCGGVLSVVVGAILLAAVYFIFAVFLASFSRGRRTLVRPFVLDLTFLFNTLVVIIVLFACLYRWAGLMSDGKVTSDLWDCIYFSITTITTVGFGDFYPCSPPGRAIAATEALSGYFLLAFLANSILELLKTGR